MQVPSGYGLHPQNYNAPSGQYSQGPGKITSLPLDSQCGDYYPGPYTVPTQNVVTPVTANQQPGVQQIYGRGPPAPHTVGSTPGYFQGGVSSASHLHTSASQPYSSLVNHYSSSAMYSANSSVVSQGFPSTCGHYAVSTLSNAAYPSVSYSSLPAGDPYGQQIFTSQNASTIGPVRENSFSGQNTALSHPSPLPPPPSQQYHQQLSLSGYSTPSWSASGLPSTQDNLIRNHTGSLATANNNSNTGRSNEKFTKAWLNISAFPVRFSFAWKLKMILSKRKIGNQLIFVINMLYLLWYFQYLPGPFPCSQLATRPSASNSLVPCHDWDLSQCLLITFYASAIVVFNVSSV